MTERELQYFIQKELSGLEGLRLWRNNTGCLTDRTGRLVTYGLCPGSADLIGLRRILITPELVGQTIGQFLAIEVKGEKGRLSEGQKNFLQVIRSLGGIGICTRDKSDIESLTDFSLS